MINSQLAYWGLSEVYSDDTHWFVIWRRSTDDADIGLLLGEVDAPISAQYPYYIDELLEHEQELAEQLWDRDGDAVGRWIEAVREGGRPRPVRADGTARPL